MNVGIILIIREIIFKIQKFRYKNQFQENKYFKCIDKILIIHPYLQIL